jgi:hypothetical protein
MAHLGQDSIPRSLGERCNEADRTHPVHLHVPWASVNVVEMLRFQRREKLTPLEGAAPLARPVARRPAIRLAT